MKNKNIHAWNITYRYVVGVFIFVAFVAFLIYAHEAVKALVIAAFMR